MHVKFWFNATHYIITNVWGTVHNQSSLILNLWKRGTADAEKKLNLNILIQSKWMLPLTGLEYNLNIMSEASEHKIGR